MGRSEMGEGGTKGNDSRIESARVEAEETTEELDILLDLSRPCACARACAWASALCCCSSNDPRPLVDGVTSLPMVVL